jgi:hypothetical protein
MGSTVERPLRTYSDARPSIGLVIGTYGGLPFVHLHLECWRRLYPHIPVLVHDDGSPDQDRLRELCTAYGADFTSNPERLGHQHGDMSVFSQGFQWARDRHLDILAKMSRRFLFLVDWTESLQNLAWQTQYETFGNICGPLHRYTRTECIAFCVDPWSGSGAADAVRAMSLDPSPFPAQVEWLIHQLASSLHGHVKSIFCEEWERAHLNAANRFPFGAWDLMGDHRDDDQPHLMWYCFRSPQDYARLARDFGLCDYSLEEFAGVWTHFAEKP